MANFVRYRLADEIVRASYCVQHLLQGSVKSVYGLLLRDSWMHQDELRRCPNVPCDTSGGGLQ